MESKSQDQIAQIMGVSTVNLLGTQDWAPPMRPTNLVSLLHWSDDTPQVCFRVKDTATGQGVTSIPDEADANLSFDPAGVASAYTALLKAEQQKNLEILPALYAASPDHNPETPRIEISGQTMLVDITPDGKLQNLRPVPAAPKFSMTDQDELAVDLSALDPAVQVQVTASLQKLDAPPMLTALAAKLP